jgi:hypothetical protein
LDEVPSRLLEMILLTAALELTPDEDARATLEMTTEEA